MQLTTRGSATTVCTFQVSPVAGSPHQGQGPLSLHGTRGSCSRGVRTGNKVTPSAGLRSLVPPRGGRCPRAAVGLLRKVDELHVAKAEKCPWHAASKRWPRKWFFGK